MYFEVVRVGPPSWVVYPSSGNSQLFLVLDGAVTPSSRTATVPSEPRGLLLRREAREQSVPRVSRMASVLDVPRMAIVPAFPRVDMPLSWPSKDPQELLDYTLNWSQQLQGDTITASEWSISGSSLVEDHASFSAFATVIWLAEGALNDTYTVTNTIETAAGRIFQQSANIRILSN